MIRDRARFLLPALCLACAALLCARAAPAQEMKVLYGFDREFPPFSYERDGEPTGFDIELLNAVLKNQNVKIIHKPMDWERVQMALSAGEIHVTSGMAKTENRQLLYLFSERPTMSLKVKLFTKTRDRVGNVSQLRGKKVAVEKGSLYQRILEGFGGLNVKLFTNKSNAIKALYRGEVEAYGGADKTAYYIIRQLGLENISAVGTPLHVTNIYYAANRDQAELMRLINDGMRRVIENGTYNDLFRKWFVPELTKDEQNRLIQAATSAAVNAYAPYSQTQIGAAVLSMSGNMYTGCNIENGLAQLNASALEVALYNAVSSGETEIKATVTILPDGRAMPPTAVERQLLYEFGREVQVITEPEAGQYQVRTIPELLPLPLVMTTGQQKQRY
jgi:cytidine deaminase